MNGTVNEHTKTLINELMRSLKIQEELLRELSKLTAISSAVSAQSDTYVEKAYDNAVMRWKKR